MKTRRKTPRLEETKLFCLFVTWRHHLWWICVCLLSYRASLSSLGVILGSSLCRVAGFCPSLCSLSASLWSFRWLCNKKCCEEVLTTSQLPVTFSRHAFTHVGIVSWVNEAHIFCQLSLSKVSKVEGCHRKQMFYLPPSLEQDGSKQAPIFAKVNFALVWPPGFWHESGEGGQSDSRERAVPPLWPSPSTNKAGLSSIHSGCEFTSS